MHRNQRARVATVEQRGGRDRDRPGVALVRCPIGEAWDELGPAEQERRIAQQLGRPARGDDVVVVLTIVPNGTAPPAA